MAVMRPAHMFTVSVQADEEVRFDLPLSGLTRNVRIVADVQGRGDGEAEVSLAVGDQVVRQTVRDEASCEMGWIWNLRPTPCRWWSRHVACVVKRASGGSAGGV